MCEAKDKNITIKLSLNERITTLPAGLNRKRKTARIWKRSMPNNNKSSSIARKSNTTSLALAQKGKINIRRMRSGSRR